MASSIGSANETTPSPSPRRTRADTGNVDVVAGAVVVVVESATVVAGGAEAGGDGASVVVDEPALVVPNVVGTAVTSVPGAASPAAVVVAAGVAPEHDASRSVAAAKGIAYGLTITPSRLSFIVHPRNRVTEGRFLSTASLLAATIPAGIGEFPESTTVLQSCDGEPTLRRSAGGKLLLLACRGPAADNAGGG